MAKLGGVKKDLDKWRIKESDQFSKRVTKRLNSLLLSYNERLIDVLKDL